MTLFQEQVEFVRDLSKLFTFIATRGDLVTIGEALRTVEQQKIYLEEGKSQTMNSYHLNKLAIDLNLIVNGAYGKYDDYKPIGEYWESLSPKNKWGGHFSGFKDCPHFERRI